MSSSLDSKRIAKNTMMLYIRMFLIMGVSLYTSRVILQVLGVESFGIYNVVGGIVSLFAFINGSMTLSVQRFLSYEIGRGNEKDLNEVFCMSVNIHMIISLIVLLFAETLGLYLLLNFINFSHQNIKSVFWLYQWSVFACCFSFFQVPYNALIISNEKMSVFAFISIFESLMQLLIVYLLLIVNVDKLAFFGFLRFVVAVVIVAIYVFFCRKKFIEAKYRFFWNKSIFRDLIGFASYSIMGEIAWVTVNQGVNIILNIFFNPIINASRGISIQVNNAVNKFVQSFQVALNPQIVKKYASNDIETMLILTYKGTKFSYFLLLFISLPFLLKTRYILSLWLPEVPYFCVSFCQLAIINSLIDVLSNLFATVAKAYGKIRNYQIIVSICLMLNLPSTFIFLKLGASPLVVFYIYGAISIILIFIRLLLIKKMINITISDYFKEVIRPISFVTFFSLLIPLFFAHYLRTDLFSFFVLCVVSFLSVFFVIYFLGLNAIERKLINNYVLRLIRN